MTAEIHNVAAWNAYKPMSFVSSFLVLAASGVLKRSLRIVFFLANDELLFS